jgi:hypothetical protein
MRLIQLFEVIKAWSARTFGTNHGPEVSITHLIHEANEILANPRDLEEYADVLILLLDGVWRAGYTYFDLVAAVEDKHKKNLTRTWHRDPDGTFQHDR